MPLKMNLICKPSLLDNRGLFQNSEQQTEKTSYKSQ